MKEFTTVTSLLDNAFEQNKEKTAIIYEDRKTTFAELEKAANAIAKRILLSGGKPGGVAGILVPRNEYTIIGAIAAMKAGMAYLPLENTLPAKRINYMIADSGASVVVVEESLLPMIETEASLVVIPDNPTDIQQWDAASKEELPSISEEDLAIILYTSGTTGTPKGVMIPHRAPASLINYTSQTYHISSDDVMGIYASYGFDAFPFCMLSALPCGAACCIVPQSIKHDMRQIYDYYYRNNVTLTLLPTAVGIPYIRNHEKGHLRVLFVGGEKMPPLQKKWEGCRLQNDYGPTESYVFCSEYEVKGDETEVPIGKAIGENIIYILSETGERVAKGETGEIVVAGPQVGKGYINHPELSAKVFTPNPFADGKYATLYHTGDLGYEREDGNIIIQGRKDKQIKIRGNRIEPSEVEKHIAMFPGIGEVVVNAMTLSHDNKALVAYVTAEETIDEKELLQFIAERCPYYMMPAAVMQLQQMPLNNNGKVDYNRLPIPVITRSEAYVAPRTDTEKIICHAFEQCFGMKDVGIDDDFEDIGGDSLSLMMLLEMCSDIGLTGAIVLNNGTPRKIAEKLDCASHHVEKLEYKDCTSIYGIQWTYYDLCESVPNNMFLHVEKGLKIGNDIDVYRLREALCQAINNHVGLKARFKRNEKGEPSMYHNDGEAPQVTIIEAKEKDMEKVKSDFMTPFHLADECPYHIAIVVTEESKYLLLDFHHFVIDGVSLALFLEDTTKAYKGEELTKETWTAFDVAMNEYYISGSDRYASAKKWYNDTFCHLTCDKLPAGDAGKDEQQVTSGEVVVPLGIRKKDLAEACKRFNTTETMMTEAAYALLLGKYTQQNEALFVTVSSGRDTPQKQHTTGFLAKSEPVYCKWDDDTTVQELNKQLKHMRLHCMANSAFIFENCEISPRLCKKSFFVYQADIDDMSSFCGAPAKAFPISKEEAYFALQNQIISDYTGTELSYLLTYKSNIYTEEFIRNYIEDYKEILLQLMEGNIG